MYNACSDQLLDETSINVVTCGFCGTAPPLGLNVTDNICTRLALGEDEIE